MWSKTERRRGTCKFGCCPGGAVIERVMYTKGCVKQSRKEIVCIHVNGGLHTYSGNEVEHDRSLCVQVGSLKEWQVR